jgi:hypothetical protein
VTLFYLSLLSGFFVGREFVSKSVISSIADPDPYRKSG